VGILSTRVGSADFYGSCISTGAAAARTISIQVADPATTGMLPRWEIAFAGLQWTEGSTASVACDHVEIWDEQVGSESIPCGGGMPGTCQVTVSRNEELERAVQVWFTCNGFETNVSTGGVPNVMSIASGAMQVRRCSGF
jgi:hypothetical protein